MAKVELSTGIKHATFTVTSPTKEMAATKLNSMLINKYGQQNVSVTGDTVKIFDTVSKMIWK